TGATGGPFTVTFNNALAAQNVAQIGATAANATVLTITDGTAGNVNGPFTLIYPVSTGAAPNNTPRIQDPIKVFAAPAQGAGATATAVAPLVQTPQAIQINPGT